MAKAAAAGHRVVRVLATRGEEGEQIPGILPDGEDLGAWRERETRDSAAALGCQRVLFLGYRDSGMAGAPENDAPESFWQADVDEAARRLAGILATEGADVLTMYDSHGILRPSRPRGRAPGRHPGGRAGGHAAGLLGDDEPRPDQGDGGGRRTCGHAGGRRAHRAGREREEFGLPDAEITHAIDVTEACWT